MLPYIDTPFVYLADTLGASRDEIKLIFSFLISYPFAALLKRLPDNRPDVKNAYIVAVSLLYLVGLFDLWAGIRTLFISAATVYAFAYYLDSSLMPWLSFIFLMGHMSLNHIYRHRINAPELVDITGAQMVLVMKLSAFAWNVHDGRLKEKDITDFQKEHRLTQMPGLLDYAAYVLFFPGLMAGPAFDYIEFKRYIETSMFDLPPGTNPANAPARRKKRRIPRSGTPATIKMLTGLAWLLAFLQLGGRYAPNKLLTPEYTQYNFLRRVWIMYITGFVTRTKYYAVWSLSEGACILSGIGYKGINPKTGKADWDRLQNVHPLGIELAQNSRAYLGNWNINTNNWLRSYVYLRVTPKGKKPGFRASLATFTTSAFWHGFEPGYYMTFVLASFIQTVAKNCRRLLRPFFLNPTTSAPLPSKRYYDMASWVATQFIFSFTVTPFMLLTLPSSLQAWAAVYFYAIIGVAASLAFFASPGKTILHKRLSARAKAAGQATPAVQTPVHEKDQGEVELLIPGQRRENVRGPALGLPDDPGRDIDEIMAEIKREVETRRARGQSVTQGLQEAMTEKISELRKEGGQQAKIAADEMSGAVKELKKQTGKS